MEDKIKDLDSFGSTDKESKPEVKVEVKPEVKADVYKLQFNGDGHVRIPGVGAFLANGGALDSAGKVHANSKELVLPPEHVDSFRNMGLDKRFELIKK